jgi:3-oxoacyl-[acyl-carrier protein] reductase
MEFIMNTRSILEGQIALVTGGTRGIGRAIAEALSEAGAGVAVASRNALKARDAAREIQQKTGVAASGFAGDVSDQESVRGLFEQVRRWSSNRLDVLVCNAGYPFTPEIWDTPLHETPPEKLESWYLDIFRTDAMGSVFCTFEALRTLTAQRRGSIIYLSSIPALAGFKGVPYTMAKAGILGLMKDVAREYGRFNIRANALALGNIRTSATFDRLDPEMQKIFAGDAPLRRWGRPEEAAQAALFLASDASSFITGQTIVVDGGIVRW